MLLCKEKLCYEKTDDNFYFQDFLDFEIKMNREMKIPSQIEI
jgi:hypothetical protein